MIDWVMSNFITDFRQLSYRKGAGGEGRGRYLMLLIFEDIYNMYQQYLAEILVNPTCVLAQSTSVDGAADVFCLLIDPN